MMTLPQKEDILFFQEHGWWVSPKIIMDETISDLLYAAEKYYAGEKDMPLLINLYNDWDEKKGNVLRQNDYISLQMAEFNMFLRQSVISEIAARLCETLSVRLFHDQMIYKPPQVGALVNTVGWHIDKAYWKTCSSDSMITAWIPLQDCNELNGTLCVIDKSHRWNHTVLRKSFHTNDQDTLEKEFKKNNPGFVTVPLNIEKGQVSFHHCLTIHGSQKNASDQPRLAYAVHFQDHDNRYKKSIDENGGEAIHTNDILCKKDKMGNPDYADLEICPVLWTNQD